MRHECQVLLECRHSDCGLILFLLVQASEQNVVLDRRVLDPGSLADVGNAAAHGDLQGGAARSHKVILHLRQSLHEGGPYLFFGCIFLHSLDFPGQQYRDDKRPWITLPNLKLLRQHYEQ
jgi:hypothetical protein